MFEIKLNEYWVKPLIISSYGHCIEIERFFNIISKFEFKQKHIIKRQNDKNKEVYDTSVVILIGETDKKELQRKYKELTSMKTGIGVSPYALRNYPLNFNNSRLPKPCFCLEDYVVKILENANVN